MVPMHLAKPNLIATFCELQLPFTLNLQKIETSFIYTFTRENKYLENSIEVDNTGTKQLCQLQNV